MKYILIISIISLFLTGCATSTVAEIKNKENIGKTVAVSGTAKFPVKIGTISGYTLVDKNGDKIIVATSKVPDAGDKVTAKGELKMGLIGYYIKES